MHFDICCCTYHSTRWLQGFFDALSKVEYDTKKLHLYFTDNASSDNTVLKLKEYQAALKDIFGTFEIIESKQNTGFGTASNTSARAGKSPYVFFYNVDTAIFPNAFTELKKAIQKADAKTGAFEMRQFPFEHPKYYDPITLKTDWASGAALILTRKVFEQTGGFDESIFMYCEDVDLSWRIRMLGYEIQYVPKAVTNHYTADDITVMKSSQMAGQLAGEKVLRLKFGTKNDVKGWAFFEKAFASRLEKDQKARKLTNELLAKINQHKSEYRRFYRKHIQNGTFEPDFSSGYTFFRSGAEYKNELPKQQIEFSLIIRTYQRPQVLKMTLQSLLNQTYKYFHVIVIEDGENPTAKEVVQGFQNDLSIEYHALNKKAGRCEAGNIGLSFVKTKYACFLDDDDYLFADYFEVNAKLIEKNPDCQMFCSSSIIARTKMNSKDGTDFEFLQKDNFVAKKLTRIQFYMGNPVAIQSVVFDIALYHEYGGFDLELDAFEDWELWIRYVTKCKVVSTEKTLSIFKVPSDRLTSMKRNQAMDQYRVKMFEKLGKYHSNFSAQDLYGLFWNPSMPLDSEKDDYLELVESVKNIQKSNIWKISKPFRFIFNKIQFVNQKIFQTTYQWFSFFGPEEPEKDCEDYGVLQSFVIRAQDCTYIRWFKKIRGKK